MFAILICCILLFWMLYLWFWFFSFFVLVFAFFFLAFTYLIWFLKLYYLFVVLVFNCCFSFVHISVMVYMFVGLGFCFCCFVVGVRGLFLFFVLLFFALLFVVLLCVVVVCLFFLLCLLFVVGPQRNKLRKRSDIEASNFMTNSRQFHDRLVSCERASVLHARWRDRAIDKTEIGRPRALKFTYMGAMGPC